VAVSAKNLATILLGKEDVRSQKSKSTRESSVSCPRREGESLSIRRSPISPASVKGKGERRKKGEKRKFAWGIRLTLLTKKGRLREKAKKIKPQVDTRGEVLGSSKGNPEEPSGRIYSRHQYGFRENPLSIFTRVGMRSDEK